MCIGAAMASKISIKKDMFPSLLISFAGQKIFLQKLIVHVAFQQSLFVVPQFKLEICEKVAFTVIADFKMREQMNLNDKVNTF